MKSTIAMALATGCFLTLSLGACVGPNEIARQVAGQSDGDLCIAYVKLPPRNLYQITLFQEIARRHLDCSQYAGCADEWMVPRNTAP